MMDKEVLNSRSLQFIGEFASFSILFYFFYFFVVPLVVDVLPLIEEF